MAVKPAVAESVLVNSPIVNNSLINQGNPFKPLPLSVENTHVNITRFAELLHGHPDRHQVEYILHGLRHGFDIGFQGQILGHTPRNNKSARDNHIKVTLAINKEISRGHTAGPFHQPPFQVNHISPLGAAPKQDGSCRLVLDLSQPQGESINDYIDKTEFPCSYMHFDTATELVVRVGMGCYLSKIDIKHAYRLLPVRPADWPLLVYQWEGRY